MTDYINENGKTGWLVDGDFNEVMKTQDKYGGNPINSKRSNLFWKFINHNNLVDVGFKGSKFTWTNKRYRNRNDLILKRLDKCFANDSWIHIYPESQITHLPRIHFDHCSLLVNLSA